MFFHMCWRVKSRIKCFVRRKEKSRSRDKHSCSLTGAYVFLNNFISLYTDSGRSKKKSKTAHRPSTDTTFLKYIEFRTEKSNLLTAIRNRMLCRY